MTPSTCNYRNVTWHKGHHKFVAKTKYAGRYVTLFYSDSAEDAARVIDCANKLLRGPNAILNFDGLPPPSMTTADVRAMLVKRGLIRPTPPNKIIAQPLT